jgi:error-prone DNA polymerase
MSSVSRPAAPAYAELHCLSNFTFQRGASTAKELFARAKRLDYTALAITDECSLAGIVRAYEAAKDTGLKLIVGAEFALADGPRFALLAQDHDGYTNLCRLITQGRRAAEKGEYHLTRADLEAQPRDGLLALWLPPPCRSGGSREAPRDRTHINPNIAHGPTAQELPSTSSCRSGGSREAPRDPTRTDPNTAHGPTAQELPSTSSCRSGGSREAPRDPTRTNPNTPDGPTLEDPQPAGCCSRDAGIRPATPFRLNAGSTSRLPSLPQEQEAASPERAVDDVGADALRWLAGLFPARCWIALELHRGPHDATHLAALRELSTATGIPLVAASDAHMHVRRRKALQDTLTAIRLGTTVADAGHALLPNGERHLRRREDLATLYPPGALAETVRLADRCTFTFDQLRYEYPRELVPAGVTASAHLRALTEAGLCWRFPLGTPQKVQAQVEHELGLIAELKYESYFLTVHDAVRYAREQGILCQGRGSAANSAVCFALGITEVDPSRMNMLFERFISKERNEPPDIDVDFEHERREEVIQYLYRKYGRQRAALAATVISYRPKSAVRDVGKALGLSLDQLDQVTRALGWWDEAADIGDRLRQAGLDPDSPVVRRMLALSRELLDFPRHLSQHVGGFVISEHPLHELVPVENAAMPERTVIQWDKDDLDTLGLLKVDCLALGMLTCLHRAFDLVAQHRGYRLTPATVPAEDPETYAMIQRADTLGVFQIESRAQMAMLPRLKPANYYDLVIEVAIVRPGPIQGKMVHPYLRRRQGLEPVTYPSEALRAVFGRTLGVPIFQEQVMQLAIVAAGFTPGEADRLRRSMAAWKRRGGLEPFQQRILDGMAERGYSTEFALQVFEQIKGFGSYGFPESHSASFALIVYVSCWLKRHEPAAFACALLNSQPMGFYQPSQIIQDLQRHGVTVRPVDVMSSAWDCSLEPMTESTASSRCTKSTSRTASTSRTPSASPHTPSMSSRAPSTSPHTPSASSRTPPASSRRKPGSSAIAPSKASFPRRRVSKVEMDSRLRGNDAAVDASPLGKALDPGFRRDDADGWDDVDGRDADGWDDVDGRDADGWDDVDGRGADGWDDASRDDSGGYDVGGEGVQGESGAGYESSEVAEADRAGAARFSKPVSDSRVLALRLGLRLLQGISADAGGRIVAARTERPFADVQDLVDRARLNRFERARLAEGGALRSLAGHRHRAHWAVAGAETLPDVLDGSAIPEQSVSLRPPTTTENVLTDYARYGFSLERHPLALIRAQLRARKARSAAEIARTGNGTPLRAAGLVTVRQRPGTASGVTFVTIEDETGTVNVVVWLALAQRQRRTLIESTLLAIDGELQEADGVRHLIARRLHDWTPLMPNLAADSRDFH